MYAQALTPETALALPHLQDDDQKEKEVGYALELLVQVQGQEGEEVVLGRADDIVLERELGSRCRPGQRPPACPAQPASPCPPATTSCNGAPTEGKVSRQHQLSPCWVQRLTEQGCDLSIPQSDTHEIFRQSLTDMSYLEGFPLTYFNGHWGGAKETENSHQKDDLFILKTLGEVRCEAGGEGRGAGVPTLYFFLCRHRKAFSLN